jgi:hypothetical protein
MAYASRAVAAMDAHREVAGVGVVQNGLRLLANLSITESNRVSGMCGHGEHR